MGLKDGEEAAWQTGGCPWGSHLGVQATGREEERWRGRGGGRAIEAVSEVAVDQVGRAPGAVLRRWEERFCTAPKSREHGRSRRWRCPVAVVPDSHREREVTPLCR